MNVLVKEDFPPGDLSGLLPSDLKRYFRSRRNLVAAGKLSQDQYVGEISARLGVEVDREGKVALYHATRTPLLVKIWQDRKERAIKPAALTGERTYRVQGEEEPEKKQKIYLALRHQIEKSGGTAESIQIEHRGEDIYILKVRVDQENLWPDEDNFGDDWLESLASWSHSCSYLGSITDFEVVARIPAALPVEAKDRYMDREIAGEDPTQVMQEAILEERQIRERNENLLTSVGLDVKSIPTLKNPLSLIDNP